MEANRKAICHVTPGRTAQEIDRCARNFIKNLGYGNFFDHGTGHGVGLQIHELPRITKKGRETVKEDMVFTVEPGIYLPGIGGIRIEDMVRVKPEGCEVLTSLPKELEIIK